MAEPLTNVMQLTTPLGVGVLRFSAMSAVEELGRLFDYSLVALSEKNDIDPNTLLGKRVSVALERSDRTLRQFNGVVTSCGLDGAKGRLFAYSLRLRPWLWLLTRRADTRIFQKQSVPEIIKKVFEPYSTDYEIKLQGTYAPLDYCVQYRETDFNFVSRLMEQEGIYYFFKHTADQHMMVIADRASVHVPVAGHAEFRYRAQSLGAVEFECINDWRFSHEIQPGKVTLRDHDFEAPSKTLEVQAEQSRSHVANKGEFYDQPGEYLTDADGKRYAQIRLEELQARHNTASGYGTMTALTIGHRFTLAEHPRKDQNREHIVVSSRIDMSRTGDEAGVNGGASYTCHFTALDSREVFRPQRVTPKPVVAGPQTAVVVGPAGEEIYTDEHGRVKVQFHWDRLGKKDAESSCWMRVAQPSAGKGWGAMALPRIGHEVVVVFLEGDPDQPIITGSVYNGENLPPYVLPDNATVSSLKSRSSKGAAASNFNELRFEDKKGSEYVWFQSEKDHFHLVKNDVVQDIGHDELVTIANDRNEKVGGSHLLAVAKDVKHKIGGSMNVEVGTDLLFKAGGDYGLKAAKDISNDAGTAVSFKAGTDVHIKAGMNAAVEAGMNAHVKGGMNVVIEAGLMLTLKAGGNSVVIGPAGVSITGSPLVMINSGGGAGSGDGASPVAPTAPESPPDPTKIKDPLPSR
ncbi:MAG: type VI secretion system tip protein VgrG [Burkholderiales bacterium]